MKSDSSSFTSAWNGHGLIVAHTHSSRHQVNSHTTPGNSRRHSFVADREPSRALGNETLGLSCHDPPQGYLLTATCLTSRRMDFQPRSAIRLSKSLQCLHLWDGWDGQERFGFLHFAFDWMHRAEWLPSAGLGYNSPHLQEPTRAPLLPIGRESIYSLRGPPFPTYRATVAQVCAASWRAKSQTSSLYFSSCVSAYLRAASSMRFSISSRII